MTDRNSLQIMSRRATASGPLNQYSLPEYYDEFVGEIAAPKPDITMHRDHGMSRYSADGSVTARKFSLWFYSQPRLTFFLFLRRPHYVAISP
jgi:hypothetical protein